MKLSGRYQCANPLTEALTQIVAHTKKQPDSFNIIAHEQIVIQDHSTRR